MLMVIGMLHGVIAIMIAIMFMVMDMHMVPQMFIVLDDAAHRRRSGKRRVEWQYDGKQDEQEATHGMHYIKTRRYHGMPFQAAYNVNSKRAPMTVEFGTARKAPGLTMRWKFGWTANQGVTT